MRRQNFLNNETDNEANGGLCCGIDLMYPEYTGYSLASFKQVVASEHQSQIHRGGDGGN